MRETLTILWDSTKLLRARKLFWIVVGISLFVGLIYASIGFNDEGVSFGFGLKKFENPLIAKGSGGAQMFYLLLFTNFIVPHWLGFIAVLLALVTSCSVFPELMKEGSIETVVSKPVSRWKIFYVKYLGMLGFMALPLAMFCTIVFVAMGLRVGVWKPEIFWAVPLLTFVFSILYSFAVLIGVWTKSTLFALLSTMLLWGLCFLIHSGEVMIYNLGILPAQAGLKIDARSGEVTETGEEREPDEGVAKVYQGYRKATLIVPKPRKSTLLLEKLLVFTDELGPLAGKSLMGLAMGIPEEGLGQAAQAKAQNRMSVAEVLVPSALFQIICLAWAGWMFSRRDF